LYSDDAIFMKNVRAFEDLAVVTSGDLFAINDEGLQFGFTYEALSGTRREVGNRIPTMGNYL